MWREASVGGKLGDMVEDSLVPHMLPERVYSLYIIMTGREERENCTNNIPLLEQGQYFATITY